MGGLLAFGVETPVAIGCCGGGTALLATTIRGIGVWLSDFGGLSMRFWQRSPSLSFAKFSDLPNAAHRFSTIFQTERVLLDPEY